MHSHCSIRVEEGLGGVFLILLSADIESLSTWYNLLDLMDSEDLGPSSTESLIAYFCHQQKEKQRQFAISI